MGWPSSTRKPITQPGNGVRMGTMRPSPNRTSATDSPASTYSPSTARSSRDGSAIRPEEGAITSRSGKSNTSNDGSTRSSDRHEPVGEPHGRRMPSDVRRGGLLERAADQSRQDLARTGLHEQSRPQPLQRANAVDPPHGRGDSLDDQLGELRRI